MPGGAVACPRCPWGSGCPGGGGVAGHSTHLSPELQAVRPRGRPPLQQDPSHAGDPHPSTCPPPGRRGRPGGGTEHRPRGRILPLPPSHPQPAHPPRRHCHIPGSRWGCWGGSVGVWGGATHRARPFSLTVATCFFTTRWGYRPRRPHPGFSRIPPGWPTGSDSASPRPPVTGRRVRKVCVWGGPVTAGGVLPAGVPPPSTPSCPPRAGDPRCHLHRAARNRRPGGGPSPPDPPALPLPPPRGSLPGLRCRCVGGGGGLGVSLAVSSPPSHCDGRPPQPLAGYCWPTWTRRC